MRLPALLWLFPAVVTLHNLEECIWLPEWSRHAGRWYRPVAPGVFRFAVTVLTILTYVLTWLAVHGGRQAVWAYLIFGAMVVTLANAIVPHLVVTIASRHYMPGLTTGLLLNVPVLSVLVWMALKTDYVSGAKAALACVVVPLLLLLSILLLFRLGKALISAA